MMINEIENLIKKTVNSPVKTLVHKLKSEKEQTPIHEN